MYSGTFASQYVMCCSSSATVQYPHTPGKSRSLVGTASRAATKSRQVCSIRSMSSVLVAGGRTDIGHSLVAGCNGVTSCESTTGDHGAVSTSNGRRSAPAPVVWSFVADLGVFDRGHQFGQRVLGIPKRHRRL